MKNCWIDNKIVLITGATSGLGRELTKKFVQNNNCFVYAVGRSKEKFESLKQEIKEIKNLECIACDVSNEDSWIELSDKIHKLDVIINCAGILPPFESFEHLYNRCEHNFDVKNINNNQLENNIHHNTSVEIKKVMDTNFYSIIYSCQYFMPIIEKSSTPAIINISSLAGLCPLPGISIYSASKSAVKSFTECLQLEKNYYVGVIYPGFTLTEIFRYQKHSANGKLINMFATKKEKMALQIYKAIINKKRRCVFGRDAKWMNRLYSRFPKWSAKLFANILKKSKLQLFEDVFKD